MEIWAPFPAELELTLSNLSAPNTHYLIKEGAVALSTISDEVRRFFWGMETEPTKYWKRWQRSNKHILPTSTKDALTYVSAKKKKKNKSRNDNVCKIFLVSFLFSLLFLQIYVLAMVLIH